MGAGASKHGNVKRKVQAVNAFEDAGKRHREKGKKTTDQTQKKKNKKKQPDVESRIKTPEQSSEHVSRWTILREKTLTKSDVEMRRQLRLSDFNKIIRKKTLDEDDETPIEIPYEATEKVEPEELCDICSVYTGRETYPCRICLKVYHEGCLRKLGHCCDPASSILLKRALKPIGWSCHNCDNLSNLLTEQEMIELMTSFERHEVTQDCSITLDDYLDYRRRLHKDISNNDMTTEQQQDITIIFHRIDKNGSGSVTWWEFLNYESARCLQDRKSKNSVTRLLSPREIELARRLFRVFDQDGDGNITEHDAKKAIASWYTLFLEADESLNGYSLMSSNKNDELTFVLVETLTFTMDTNTDSKRQVSWQEYLKELSLYILAARPNLSPVPVEGSEWTKSVVVSTEKDCNIKQTSL